MQHINDDFLKWRHSLNVVINMTHLDNIRHVEENHEEVGPDVVVGHT
jgi:hypothetical protein